MQCIQGFFHLTKSIDSVTFPASAQRYHPRSLFQATLPSNINATTLQTCLCFGISHISLTCGLFKQLYSSICHLKLTIASDSVSLVVDSMPTRLVASVTFLSVKRNSGQPITAHPPLVLPYLIFGLCLSLVLVMLDHSLSMISPSPNRVTLARECNDA